MTARILQIVFAVALIWLLVLPQPSAQPAPVEHWHYQACNLILQYCVIA